jgi:hypothetical protein
VKVKKKNIFNEESIDNYLKNNILFLLIRETYYMAKINEFFMRVRVDRRESAEKRRDRLPKVKPTAAL